MFGKLLGWQITFKVDLLPGIRLWFVVKHLGQTYSDAKPLCNGNVDFLGEIFGATFDAIV